MRKNIKESRKFFLHEIFDLSKKEAILVWVSFLFILIGLFGIIAVPSSKLWKERIQFINRDGYQITAAIYGARGTQTESRLPGAVLCHGISCSKELMNRIGYDLAAHGFVVLTFDYGGHGESERHSVSEEACLSDVIAAIDRIRRYPRVDPDRVVLVGHSMGAVSAAMAGMVDRNIAAVVCLGQKGVGNRKYPRNLLQVYGLYDQYHTVSSMVSAMPEISGGKKIDPLASIFQIPRDRFNKPGNRALLVLPESDHSSEVYSAKILPETRNWLRRSVGLGAVHTASISAFLVYFEFLFGLGIFMAGIILLGSIRSRALARSLAFIPAIVTFFAALFLTGRNQAEPVSLVLTMVYLVFSTGLYCRWKREKGQGQYSLVWLGGLAILCLSFSLGSIIGTVGQLINIGNIPWIPVAFFNIIVHRCHFVYNILRADLFRSYSNAIRPSFIFLVLLVLEPLFPGLIWRPVGWLASRLRKRIINFELSLSLGARDIRAVVLFVLLLFAAAGIIGMRFREGLFGINSLRIAGTVMLRMYLLPFFVLVCLVRLGKGTRRQPSFNHPQSADSRNSLFS